MVATKPYLSKQTQKRLSSLAHRNNPTTTTNVGKSSMTIASDGSLMDICQAFSFPPSKIAALPAGAQQRRCFVVPTQLDLGITHPKLKGLGIIDVVLSTHSPCFAGFPVFNPYIHLYSSTCWVCQAQTWHWSWLSICLFWVLD